MSSEGPHDVVIRNGRVMDPETRFDRVCNVGIRDGRIVAITSEALEGAAESIDATGRVVAPGFIDTHHQLAPPGRVPPRAARRSHPEARAGAGDARLLRRHVVRATRREVVGELRHGELARARGASGWSLQQVDLEQGNGILREMDLGLQAGAVGVGSTLGYMRDGVSAREAFEIQKLAAAYRRQTAFHFRYQQAGRPRGTTGKGRGPRRSSR